MKRQTQDVFIYPDDVIKTARIEFPKPPEMAKVFIVVDGKEGEHLLFSYYVDELKFTSEEFIGKTVKEAQALHFDRDKAHLQS